MRMEPPPRTASATKPRSFPRGKQASQGRSAGSRGQTVTIRASSLRRFRGSTAGNRVRESCSAALFGGPPALPLQSARRPSRGRELQGRGSRVGGNQGIPGGSGYQPGNRPRSWLPPVTRRGLGLILGPTGQSSPPGNHRSLVPKPGNRAGSWFPKKNYPQPCEGDKRA